MSLDCFASRVTPARARRLAVVVATLLAPPLLARPLLAQRSAPRAACWASLGAKAEFTSGDQLRELQARVRRLPACRVIGFGYSASGRTGRLIYDRNGRQLARVTRFAGASPSYELWTGVTDQTIAADDPSDGLDVGRYIDRSADALAQLSEAVRAMLTAHVR